MKVMIFNVAIVGLAMLKIIEPWMALAICGVAFAIAIWSDAGQAWNARNPYVRNFRWGYIAGAIFLTMFIIVVYGAYGYASLHVSHVNYHPHLAMRVIGIILVLVVVIFKAPRAIADGVAILATIAGLWAFTQL